MCCSTNIYILWVLGLRKSTVVIYDGIQGAIKNVLIEKKIITKIECCGAEFSHEHDLGALDPA